MNNTSVTWRSLGARLIVPSLLLIPAKADQRVPNVTDPEAYAVYAALLPANRDLVLIRSTTSVGNDHCFPSGKPLEIEWNPVVDNFKRQNAIPRVIQPRIPTNVNYELRPEDSLWPFGFFNAGNRTTIMVLSSVAFDESKTRAIVYMASSCGVLCGKGMYQLLEKKNSSWGTIDPQGVDRCVAIE